MALKTQAAFGAGEIDPSFRERTTLEKYSQALAKCRNWVISKTGRLMTRGGTQYVRFVSSTLTNNHKHIYVKDWGLILGIYPGSFRLLRTDGRLLDILFPPGGGADDPTLDSDEISECQVFTVRHNVDFSGEGVPTNSTSRVTVVILIPGRTPVSLKMDQGFLYQDGNYFPSSDDVYSLFLREFPSTHTMSRAGNGTGYAVEYTSTGTFNEDEFVRNFFPAAGIDALLPKDESESYEIRTVFSPNPNEVKVYRRPKGGGSWGFVGYSAYDTANSRWVFVERGQDADYSQRPASLTPGLLRKGALVYPNYISAPGNLYPTKGCIYQQRMLLLIQDDTIEASRAGLPLSFYRDYPYTDSSGLSFGVGVEGNKIYHIAVANGKLLVFTNTGVYAHVGSLIPTNLGMRHVGEWVAQEDLEPVVTAAGTFFVDASTNAVRRLMWSEELGTFRSEDVSVFSSHLFENRKIVSWAYEKGKLPLLWVIFDDGEAATMSFEEDVQLKAWTTADFPIKVRQVFNSDKENVMFEVELGSNIYLVRHVSKFYEERESYQHDFFGDGVRVPLIHSSFNLWDQIFGVMPAKRFAQDFSLPMRNLLVPNSAITSEAPSDSISLTPVTPGEWDGALTLVMGASDMLDPVWYGQVGRVFRWFNPEDDTHIDLTIDTLVDENTATVVPSEEFPSEYATNPILFGTDTQVGDTLRRLSGFYAMPSAAYAFGSNNIKIQSFTPVNTGDWSGPLSMTLSGAHSISGIVGVEFVAVLKKSNAFYTKRMRVTAETSSTVLVVEFAGTFDDTYSGSLQDGQGYTLLGISRLTPFNDQEVSVIADGGLVSSPNNPDYPTITVTNAQFTLDEPAAIVNVGLPFTADIETLDIDTVEQAPSLIESQTVNKLYVKTHETIGLHVANRFPQDDSIEGSDVTGTNMVEMKGLSSYDVNYEEEDPIIGNRPPQPTSKRHEIVLTGDWDSNGRIAIRQVDPYHAEILSIICDTEVLRR